MELMRAAMRRATETTDLLGSEQTRAYHEASAALLWVLDPTAVFGALAPRVEEGVCRQAAKVSVRLFSVWLVVYDCFASGET